MSDSSSSVILRFRHLNHENASPIDRLKGYLSAYELAKLFNNCTLAANPRLPAMNKVVREMLGGLENDPANFRYCNNGVLVAASDADLTLERDRVELVFDPLDDPESPRGILNGGHTTFASLIFLIQTAAVLHDKKEPKIKDWTDLKEAWGFWRDEAMDVAKTLGDDEKFHVPIEVLFPTVGMETSEFDEHIMTIADGRNNNCQLTDETKAHFVGMFEELKSAMPEGVSERVEWKTNTPGADIGAKDVIALACIPLVKAALHVSGQDELNDFPKTLDLKAVASGPKRCSTYYQRLYRSVSESKGNRRVLKKEHFKLIGSAISCTEQVIEAYDWLECNFPQHYIDAGGKFYGLEKIGRKPRNKKGKKPTSKFLKNTVEQKYSDAMFVPILVSLRALLTVEKGELVWRANPVEFLKRNLNQVMGTYKSTFEDNGNNSRELSRSDTAYELVQAMFDMIVKVEHAKANA